MSYIDGVISKAKLLELLDKNAALFFDLASLRAFKRDIESNTFDLLPTDVDLSEHSAIQAAGKRLADKLREIESADVITNDVMRTAQFQERFTDVEVKEIEAMKERTAIASAYWLDCSPHERTEEDGLVMARYVRKVMPLIDQLLTKLAEKEAEIQRLREYERLYRTYLDRYTQAVGSRNQAVKALEQAFQEIDASTVNGVLVANIICSALQSIKGE